MVNVKRYIIDYVKLVRDRVPSPLLDFADVLAYLQILSGPFVFVYNQLNAFRTLLIYKITITPQVCYLEKLLNDQFDNNLRRIYIEDGNIYEGTFIFQEAEETPVFLYQEGEAGKPLKFIYTEGESSGEGSFDFVVYVPGALSFDFNEMSSLIRQFKLASKLFAIQTF